MNLLCTASISDPGRAWRRFGALPTIFIDHQERNERNDGDKTDHPVPGHLPRGMGSSSPPPSLAPCGKRLGMAGVEGSSSLVNNNQRLTKLRRQRIGQRVCGGGSSITAGKGKVCCQCQLCLYSKVSP